MYPVEMASLLRLAGRRRCSKFCSKGAFSDQEALAKGLVTRVVADSEVVPEAYASARRICEGAPRVARWHKQWVRRCSTIRRSVSRSCALRSLSSTAKITARVCRLFVEKRKPQFMGR
jgi:enoyl-CoA hydratase